MPKNDIATEKGRRRADMTGMFPFIVSEMSPYYDR
jgi:hypothetical protein